MEKLSHSLQVGDEQVGIAVVVKIDPGGSFASIAGALNARFGRDLFEGAVPFVAVELVGLAIAADEEVEETVVVEIGPRRGDRVDWMQQPRLLGDVGERAVA